jgi:hypothetical protein
MSRFEAGLERNVVIEALNDHLLALRFVLEGGGPADLGLSMRVAALCAEPERRQEVKAVVDRAIGLERELWSGEPAPGARGLTPAETAIELETLARAILKDAACGLLGSDLRATADEILLADGLAVGDGAEEHRGATAEWDVGDAEEEREVPELIDELERFDREISVTVKTGAEDEEVSPLDARISPEPDEEVPDDDANEPERPVEIEEESEQMRFASAPPPSPPEPEPEERPVEAIASGSSSPVVRLIEQTRAERAARQGRVADLFPKPETTEWNVREIAYDRRRRAEVSRAS